MVTHVVLWKFSDHAAGADREANLARAKERLASIGAKIPGIREWKVGINMTPGPKAYDLALVSTFADQEALRVYVDHPLHLEVVQFLRSVQIERAFVDFES
jgi:hypothetical protein